MMRTVVRALLATIVFAVLTGLLYPLAMTAFAQVTFKDAANGSLVEVNGQPVGSSLIGQQWNGPHVVLRPPVGRRRRRIHVLRLEPRTAIAGPCRRHRQARGGGSQAGVPVPPGASGRRHPRRPPHELGKRSRPRHLGRGGPIPSAADRRRAQPRPRAGACADRRPHPAARSLGFLGEPRVNVLELNIALQGVAPSA